jgi:hypothetical protein
VRQHQSELLPIPDEDVLWLDDIRASNEAGIPDIARLPAFSRLVDNHLAVGYRGELGEWYDVHPLITKFVAERAVVYRATRRNVT